MPANKYALFRYRIIDKLIRNKYKPYPNKEELRQGCEDELYNSFNERVSASTIEKDLYAMRNDMLLGYEAPIEYSKEHKGYYYTNKDYSIDDLPLQEEDIESIRFAISTLNQFKEAPVFKAFQSAISKIFERVQISSDLNDNNIDKVLQFESNASYGSTQHLIPVLEAINGKQAIKFEYLKFGSKLVKSYSLIPLQLKEYRGRWYLIGSGSDKNVKTFALDRIKTVFTEKPTFAPPTNFDSDTYFSNTIGITTIDKKPQRIKLKFDKSQLPYIQSQPIHKSQNITEAVGDTFTLELFVTINYELINLLLGYGSNVKVVLPKELQQHIIKEHRKSLDAYLT